MHLTRNLCFYNGLSQWREFMFLQCFFNKDKFEQGKGRNTTHVATVQN